MGHQSGRAGLFSTLVGACKSFAIEKRFGLRRRTGTRLRREPFQGDAAGKTQAHAGAND
jgi:hypothetical protein